MSSDFSYVMDEVSKEVLRWRAEYAEDIPVNVLVFEVAKVMQDCTMRPGVRPLALAVLVGGENRQKL
jgi:20S proteasome alpha/beta subunit